MPPRFVLPAALVSMLVPSAASAGPAIASHRAVYDLTLAQQGQDIIDAQGRIALELHNSCDHFDLNYRFVARFVEDQEMILTDQRTTSRETMAGDRFEFTTQAFVDGVQHSVTKGEAVNDGNATRVELEEPAAQTFELPLSVFPMKHTVELIEQAEMGRRIVEVPIFDGDQDANQLLTSTAIIIPDATRDAETAGRSGPKPDSKQATAQTKPDGGDAKGKQAIRSALAGLKSWRVSESYYSADSNEDGMPIFRTAYRLYENGVSDELLLDYGSYALEGGLSTLDYLDAPACP
ncbi:EipB family protein [Consotaella aegiceratis]|uniref:EipB family protein n=1 Tax=Consotaella aegiceratis TaxID=3097961 RepID=UPI002F4057D5